MRVFFENVDVSKEDRVRQVLRVLVESGFALPPVAIFRNAKIRGATFERRSVNNYLDQLQEERKVKIVDPEELDNGRIVEVESKPGYYMATEEGVESIEEYDS